MNFILPFPILYIYNNQHSLTVCAYFWNWLYWSEIIGIHRGYSNLQNMLQFKVVTFTQTDQNHHQHYTTTFHTTEATSNLWWSSKEIFQYFALPWRIYDDDVSHDGNRWIPSVTGRASLNPHEWSPIQTLWLQLILILFYPYIFTI